LLKEYINFFSLTTKFAEIREFAVLFLLKLAFIPV